MTRLEAFRAMTPGDVVEALVEDGSLLRMWQEEIGKLDRRRLDAVELAARAEDAGSHFKAEVARLTAEVARLTDAKNRAAVLERPPNWPIQSFDAMDWAKAFCKQFPGFDEGTALAWFACALMRGWDEKTWRLDREAAARQREEVVPPSASMSAEGENQAVDSAAKAKGEEP